MLLTQETPLSGNTPLSSLQPPCDAFFLAPRHGDWVRLKSYPQGIPSQKRIGFRQCPEKGSRENFVGFFRK